MTMAGDSLFKSLPRRAEDLFDWKWENLAPYYAELSQRPLREDPTETWLSD